MTDTPVADAELRDGMVPLDAPCVNAYVVGVLIVDPSTPAPTLASIAPNTAEVGAAPLTMTATGTGFTPNAVIVWNGGDEPTTFVSSTSLTTQVQPATASGAGTVPVLVRDGARRTAARPFTFTTPAEPEPELFTPDAHTVADTVAYMDANPDEVARIQDAERAGRARVGILDYVAD